MLALDRRVLMFTWFWCGNCLAIDVRRAAFMHVRVDIAARSSEIPSDGLELPSIFPTYTCRSW